MPTWLVTGGAGFLGRHLVNQLRETCGEHVEICFLGRRSIPGWPAARFFQADLDDPSSIARAIARVSPDVVFHLAARTPPADAPSLYRTNVGGTLALIRALRELERPSRLLTVGSAAELGPVPPHLLPVAEDCPCRPDGPYGLSKWFASRATIEAPLPVEGLVARLFNPIGPGLPTTQAFGRFAQLLATEGADPVLLRTGNLSSRRDFTDVRDVANALVALALRGGAGRIYHVGRGDSTTIRSGLEQLVALSGRRALIEADPAPPAGPADSRADISAITKDTGWTPKITISQSLGDLWASLAPSPSRRADPSHHDSGPRGSPRLPSQLCRD